MLPTPHEFLENTIPSMRAAFDFGADAVELDIHRTRDDQFAVFHDWDLGCRTNGQGAVWDHTLAELQALDIGYGYTADGGHTYPFRGRAIGLMPSLQQVLATFPDRNLVLDIKNNDQKAGPLLAALLQDLPPDRRRQLQVIGGRQPVEFMREQYPELVTITRGRLKRCLLRYMAWGWSGVVPADCERGLITVPANIAPYLWGWPHRFGRRMSAVGSRVVLIGDYQGSISRGFDDPDRLHDLRSGFSGSIWTNRIDHLAPGARRLQLLAE